MKNLAFALGTLAVAAIAVFQLSTVTIGSQSQLFASDLHSKDIEEAFIHYIAKYGKTYATKEEVTKRYNNFARSFKLVQEHN